MATKTERDTGPRISLSRWAKWLGGSTSVSVSALTRPDLRSKYCRSGIASNGRPTRVGAHSSARSVGKALG